MPVTSTGKTSGESTSLQERARPGNWQRDQRDRRGHAEQQRADRGD